MSEKIKIILVDNHQIFIDALKRLIKDERQLSVIGSAVNGEELLELLKNLTPDIIILDLEMPIMNGEKAFEIIKKQYPSIKVIILSGFLEEPTISYFMEEGANAVIAKEWDEQILLDAIYTVWVKGCYFNPQVSLALLDKLQKKKVASAALKKLDLSEREIEVLIELLKGSTNKEAAESLNIVASTVDFHRRRIYAKTNTDNMSDLTKYAIKNGIISLST